MEKPSILLADDEDPLRELLKEQLGSHGYSIDEARNGVEAIDRLGQMHYDLVILDINMPKKTGLDVLKYIRDNNIPIRVIMLTGRLGFSVGSESMLLGADEYINKPFDLGYLEMVIKRVLAKEISTKR